MRKPFLILWLAFGIGGLLVGLCATNDLIPIHRRVIDHSFPFPLPQSLSDAQIESIGEQVLRLDGYQAGQWQLVGWPVTQPATGRSTTVWQGGTSMTLHFVEKNSGQRVRVFLVRFPDRISGQSSPEN
jgi:hypothetical protein